MKERKQNALLFYKIPTTIEVTGCLLVVLTINYRVSIGFPMLLLLLLVVLYSYGSFSGSCLVDSSLEQQDLGTSSLALLYWDARRIRETTLKLVAVFVGTGRRTETVAYRSGRRVLVAACLSQHPALPLCSTCSLVQWDWSHALSSRILCPAPGLKRRFSFISLWTR